MPALSRTKKSKPAAPQRRYLVGLLGKSPMKMLGPVYAASEQAAIEAAVAEFKVPDALRFKLVARPAGY